MMKMGVGRRNLLVFCLGGAIVAGGWALWERRAGRVLSAAELLNSLPAASGPSPTDKSVALWAERARKDPRSVLAWTNLGDALMQKSRETMDVAYYGRAEAAFVQALDLNPNNTPAITGIAWVHGSRHEFERSIEWARKALAVDSNSQDAYGLLGDAAVEMGDYEGAFRDYQRMLDIRPDLSSYSRGAHLLFLTGDTRKAVWLMEKAIAAGAPRAENTAWCRAQLALMLWNTGMLLPAVQTAEVGLVLAPDNYHLLAVMGRIKAGQQDYGAAIEYYKKASAAVPHHEVVVALGDLYSLMGRQDEALKQYALVEAIHAANKSKGVQGSLELARFYADHDQRLAEALRIAEAEHKTRPNILAADTLAWCYYKLGRYEEAKRTIAKALAKNTPDAMFLFHAGMIYEKLGDRPRAQEFLYRAVSLNPGFHPLYAKVATDTLAELEGDRAEMRHKRGPLIVGVVLALLAAVLPALSHPLGNFSIDHYSRFRVTPADLRLRYVIDMAEIPTFQELLDIDIDRDRQITTDERQAYLERTVKALAARLTATLNGTPLTWQVDYRNLTTPSVVAPSSAGGGAVTLRLLLDLRAEFPTPLSDANIVRYADGNYSGRTGWKEVVVEGNSEVRVLRSSASRKDRSNELTRYPPNVPAPPQDVTAEFAFAVGAGSGWTTFLVVLRDYPSVWLMAVLAALSVFAGWWTSRKAGDHANRAR